MDEPMPRMILVPAKWQVLMKISHVNYFDILNIYIAQLRNSSMHMVVATHT